MKRFSYMIGISVILLTNISNSSSINMKNNKNNYYAYPYLYTNNNKVNIMNSPPNNYKNNIEGFVPINIKQESNNNKMNINNISFNKNQNSQEKLFPITSNISNLKNNNKLPPIDRNFLKYNAHKEIKPSSLTIDFESKSGKYSCTYMYYDNNTTQPKINKKSCSDFNDFIQSLSKITNNNFSVASGKILPVSSNELKDLGIPVHWAIQNKIFLNGVKIDNINKLCINGNSYSPILQMKFDNIEHVHFANTNIWLSYISLLSIIVDNNTTSNKIINASNKSNAINKICMNNKNDINVMESECEEDEEYEEEEEDDSEDYEIDEKFEVINNDDSVVCGKYRLNISDLITKICTILQSNLPIKINGKLYRKDTPGYSNITTKSKALQYNRKLVVYNQRRKQKDLTVQNNITIKPYEEVYW